MSWIHGTATDYIDLSNAIVEAATEASVATVGISSGGSGYVVGDILSVAGGTGTVTAQIEVTSVAAGVIDGVRIYNSGVYTVNPSSPNSATGGSGSSASLTLTFADNGWTAELDQAYSGSNREVVLNGEGGGTDEIFVGWRTFHNVPGDYYNFELHGLTGYDSGLDFDEQVGISPGFFDASVENNRHGAYLLAHNTSIEYWLNIDSYRIIIFAKVGSAYFNAYLGFGNRFGTAGEIPYPMVVAGHTSEYNAPSSQSQLSSGLVDPWRSTGANTAGPMFVLNTDNTWLSVANGHVSTGSKTALYDRVVIPCQIPDGVSDAGTPSEDKFTLDYQAFGDIIPETLLSGPATANLQPTPGTTDQRVIFPAIVVMTDPQQIPLELDDVFWVHAFGSMTSEDRIIISDEVYRVFQNCNRTDSYAYLAVKEL